MDYRSSQDGKFEDSESSVNGLQTLIYTINNIGNKYTIKLMSSGGYINEFDTESFDNVNDAVVYLLNDVFIGSNSGQNNPLHEFRLYNRAMSLTEMQDLQTELNDKYLILGNELIVNGGFDTDSDWVTNGNWAISGGTANYDGLTSTRYIGQSLPQMKKDVMYQVRFDISGGDARLNFVGRDLDNNNSTASMFKDIGVNQSANSSSFFFPSGSL